MQSKAQTSIRSKPTLFLFCMLTLVFVVSLVVDMGALLIPSCFPSGLFGPQQSSGNSSGTGGAFRYVLLIDILFSFFYLLRVWLVLPAHLYREYSHDLELVQTGQRIHQGIGCWRSWLPRPRCW